MTATLTPDPAEVASAGDPFDLDGAGFEVRQTRLVFNGVTGATFRPALDGTFTQSMTSGSDSAQYGYAQQCVAGTWTTVPGTNFTVTIGSVYTPPGTPFADMPGWQLVFDDEMDREVLRGHLMDGSPDGYHTADGRYLAFKPTWLDTSRHGYYGTQTQVAITGGVMDILCSTISGWPRTATLTCRPIGSSSQGGQLGGRSHIRCRADALTGYKGVPLWWADAAHTNDELMTYGEIDWPESEFTQPPHGYMHRTGATSLSDQYVAIPSPDLDWNDWHDYVVEWIPGTSVKFFVDGSQVGTTQTSRVPNTPMHLNLQFETATGGAPAPSPLTTGSAQIERVGIWRPV